MSASKMQIVSRQDALANGLIRYFTGAPCKRGHNVERRAHSGDCIQCISERDSLQRKEHLAGKRSFRGRQAPTRPRPDVCELCEKPSHLKYGLAFDHCHETGRFRGWLCMNCNTSIGKLGDNIEGLEKAISYLKRFN